MSFVAIYPPDYPSRNTSKCSFIVISISGFIASTSTSKSTTQPIKTFYDDFEILPIIWSWMELFSRWMKATVGSVGTYLIYLPTYLQYLPTYSTYLLTVPTCLQYLPTYSTFLNTVPTYMQCLPTYSSCIHTVPTCLQYLPTYSTYLLTVPTYIQYLPTYSTYLPKLQFVTCMEFLFNLLTHC